jgi:PKD repeat protein
MKKQVLFLVVGIIILISACKPVENRQEAGPIMPATEFTYTITNDATNDYILYLNNTTPGVMFSWDYAWGVSRKQMDTVQLLVPGTYTIKITATTAGGLVTTTKEITVTQAKPGVFQEPEWTYLSNLAAGKTWIWDDTKPAPWGNGGYRGCTAPCWWAVSKTDLNGRGVGSDEMTFDLNGGRNLTLTAAQDPAAYKGVTKGSFDLTFGNTWPDWVDIGKLTTANVTVINGMQVNFSNQIENNFYILKLTATELVLSAPEPGVTGAWGTAWFWMFKPKP